jgi:hypothetical protein
MNTDATIVYTTRLRLRSRWLIPRFLWANIPIFAQLKRAVGYRGGRSILEAGAVFWTMSLWTDEAAMRAFKASGAHGAVMPKNIDWSIESSGAGWARDTLPTWEEAHAHMIAHGHVTRVRNPSPDHAAMNYAPPRPLLRFVLPAASGA